MEKNANRISNIETIIVHNGCFHADDVICASLLRIVRPDANIIRTRDIAVIEQGLADENTLVADVGYGEYDHHQTDNGSFVSSDGIEIPHCACTKVWMTYGYQIVKAINPSISDNIATIVTDDILHEMLSQIAERDNGVTVDHNALMLNNIVKVFNATNGNSAENDTQFEIAVGFVKEWLAKTIATKINSVKDGLVVKCALDNAKRVGQTVIVFDRPVMYGAGMIQNDGWSFIDAVVNQELNGEASVHMNKNAQLFTANFCLNGEGENLPGMTFAHKNGFLVKFIDLDSAINGADIISQEYRMNMRKM